ncbi:MAG: biotin/lipoyl-binding protein [Planctomycetes bacterium]|nr:biotin/lipoyl-binding protein [Planctomycetota bacterium]
MISMTRLRRLINGSLALLLLLGGGLTAVVLTATRPAPPVSTAPAYLPTVAVYEMVPRTFAAPVVGYGTVRPKNQVKIIPQVSGMLTGMHPDLAEGKIVREGETLFEIDRQAYESQVIQVEADITLLEAQVQRHAREEASLKRRLEIAKKQFEIAERGWNRETGLLPDTSEIEVDLARQKMLQVEDVVLGLESQLDLMPILKTETQARLKARRAQLADAKRNLDNTRIVCPFDARVDHVSARTSQVVIANLAIATLTAMDAFELAAVLDPSDLQWTDRRAYARAVGSDLGEPPAVTVTWTLHGQRYHWTGQVSRLERHDEATRTARIVIEIPNSLEEIGSEPLFGRPQLSIGMFCAAEIPAEPLEDALVLPRRAIHEDNIVYVFEPDPASTDGQTGRLAARRVPLLRSIGDEVLVDFARRSGNDRLATDLSQAICELQAGELVVVSPLPRPVEGMKLRLRDGVVQVDLPNRSLFARAGDAPIPEQFLNWNLPRSTALIPTIRWPGETFGAR